MDAPGSNASRGTLPWIGSGYRPWPGDDAPTAPGRNADEDSVGDFLTTVDPPVRPLVEAMNRTGWIHTVFSCGGHPEETDSAQWGRRQAHVDVLIRRADLDRWQRFAERCAHLVRDRVAALSLQTHVDVRCAEASLGDVPAWLADLLTQEGVFDSTTDSRSWISRRLSLRRQPLWLYRRMVFEPVPYDAAPESIRRVLDTALAAALAAICSDEQANISQAST